MFLAIILTITAIGFLCWALFTLATLALPFFAAMTVGSWVYDHGGGITGAFLFGALVGGATLAVGRRSFALVRSPVIRLMIGLVFALPAAVAGYHAVHGIAGIGVASEAWRQALAVVGALIIGSCAWMRISADGAGPGTMPPAQRYAA